ncbi:PQQ-binding-like beta-propeller repeat protein [Amycolatopsis suaedae]|uniref:PQQ-binding-like beta-propeller repeat protein n=1 Tax=Amycolatopsis suaedae TaxID=2510978 RepID=A0A4Q7J6G1_9PSEU|nr:PQQ-binding-like beta-propeller repeat protein [Amycolatopsis suaedae]RZQ62352.1 hypothetical protein EWH70_18945 [Amycolatopsis suaedae]
MRIFVEDSRRPKPVVLLAAAVAVVVALGVVVIGWLDRGDAPSGFDVAWELDGQALDNATPGQDPRNPVPVVIGDVVVLVDRQALVALDVATGGLRWRMPVTEDRYCGFGQGPDALYLNLRDDNDECLTLARIEPDGREAWRTRVGAAPPAPGERMVIAGRPDGVVVVVGGSIMAYPVTGGDPKWTHTIPVNDWGDSAYGYDCRFVDAAIGADAIATRIGCAEPVFATSSDSAVLELRAIEDGSVRQRGPVTSGRGQVLLHVSGGGVVTGSPDETGFRLAFHDAQLRQTAVYPLTAASAPRSLQLPVTELPQDIRISGDLLFALGAGRRPVAIRISTGELEWQAEDGEDAGCGGLVWDGALLVCGEERTMSAYELATGDLEADQDIDVDGLADPERTLISNWDRLLRVGDRVIVQDGDESLIGLVRK